MEDSDGDGLDDLLDNAPLNNQIHEFLIYETEKNDRKLKSTEVSDRPDDYKYADKSKAQIKSMPFLSGLDFTSPVFQHKAKWQFLVKCFSMGELEKVALDMIDHFMSGSSEDYYNDTLNTEIKNHDNTYKYVASVTDIVNNHISTDNGNLYSLFYDANTYDLDIEQRKNSKMVEEMSANGIMQPIYNDYFSGLGICVDGLYGNKFEITSYEFDGINYTYTVHFTLYDIFGLDDTDITDKLAFYIPPFGVSSGFRSWYLLQHYDKFDGKYKPFISYMEFDETIEGSII